MSHRIPKRMRNAALGKPKCLILAKVCSIGLRLGEYGGRNQSLAPTTWIVCRMTKLPIVWNGPTSHPRSLKPAVKPASARG